MSGIALVFVWAPFASVTHLNKDRMQSPPNSSDSNNPFSNEPQRALETPPHVPEVPLISPSRGPVISFDAISDGWNLFRADMAIWIGVAFLTLAAQTALTFWLLATLPDPATGRQFTPVFWLALLVFSLVGTFFHGGMFRVALGQIRSGHARFSDLWSSIDALPALLGVTLVEVLGICVGSCFCLVPGLLLMGLLMFAAPLVVDPKKKMGVIESLSASFQALKPQMWMALVFAIVCYLLAQAGQIACGIGVVVTLPLFYLSMAVAYRDFFLNEEMPPPISPVAWQAPPPIADPHK